jgi:thiamine pyrophosphate-dependent acetolactate synthase large subunit-like protein
MKDLIKQYLDGGISRRNFLSGLGALGMTSLAAESMARSQAPFVAGAEEGGAGPASWMRRVRGTGGELLVAQLKETGLKHVFINPSSPSAAIYDALVDAPELQPILVLQEGSLSAMADGYAKASGKTPVLLISPHGVANCMSQMRNAFEDNIPMVVVADGPGDDTGAMTAPITKWHWSAQRAQGIPELTRRAFKFASTQPCGPVFLSCPTPALTETAEAQVMDQSKFNITMKIRPEQDLVEQTARMLLEAQTPLLYVGDEVAWCGAEKEVVELAELLGLPATRPRLSSGWSRPFPTRHPLYLGDYLEEMRYPAKVDFILNLGSKIVRTAVTMDPARPVKLVQVRMNPDDAAQAYPTELFLVGDLKLTIADLVSALKSLASAAKLKQLRDSRFSKTQEYTSQNRALRQSIARSHMQEPGITLASLGMELEDTLEKNTCVLTDPEQGRAALHNLLETGGDDKRWFSQGGIVLGWAVGASLGVKLALPDRPVVAVTGDGAFNFNGPQPLWSMARYHAGITVVIVNNRSYNRERTTMWSSGGRQFQTGKDIGCYLGDPDIDYAKMAASVGVEGETVPESSGLRSALQRAKRANTEGRPYLLDVHVEREGFGANSSWHPEYSIATQSKGKG